MSAPTPPWPLEVWYVACMPDELGDKPLGRRLCGHRMVLFRGADGRASALEDFCPHRGAPLSLGTVKHGKLVCGYHGLTVEGDGAPFCMPGQRTEALPRVRAFPTVERYGFVWVWPGDPARADEALLPALTWAESPDWAYGGGLFNVACDYRLMVDNLMDLTHETYVHATSIGQKEIDEAPVTTRRDGDTVVTSRFMEGVQPPPFWRANLRSAGLPDDGPVDRWQICRFSLPSHVMIEVGVALEGRGGYNADPADKVASVVVDFMTPETEASHWYFWGMARSFAVHDSAVTQSIREGQHLIFSEDLQVLEQQQANLTAYPDRRLLRLNIDAGGVHSRKLIEVAIAREAAG
jgi:vanillate O-demethylase monooxygenase subunit